MRLEAREDGCEACRRVHRDREPRRTVLGSGDPWSEGANARSRRRSRRLRCDGDGDGVDRHMRSHRHRGEWSRKSKRRGQRDGEEGSDGGGTSGEMKWGCWTVERREVSTLRTTAKKSPVFIHKIRSD